LKPGDSSRVTDGGCKEVKPSENSTLTPDDNSAVKHG
jgi:hypothetical protein